MQSSASDNKILYLISLNHAVNDGSTSLIATLFPFFLITLGFPAFQIGILVATGYVVNVICQPLIGRYAERFEPRNLLSLGISLMALAMLFFTLSANFSFILISIVILRIGSSFYHPVGVTAVSRSYSGIKLDWAMGFQSALGNFGIFAVFLASAYLLSALGLRYLFLMFAIIELSVVVTTLILMRNVKLVSGIRSSQATMQSRNTGSYAFKLPFFFIVTMLISGGSYAVIVNYANSFLLLDANLGLAVANLLVASWIISGFIGALASGRLTGFVGRVRFLTVSYISCAATLLIIAIFPRDLLIMIPSLIVNGFALAVTYPAIYAELSAFLGVANKNKGPSYGILFSSQIIGSAVLGLVGGLIWNYGHQILFELTSLILFVGFVFTLLWVRRT